MNNGAIIEMLEQERDKVSAAIEALRGGERKRRHMSVAARKRIGAATRRRWALKRRQAKES